MSVWKSRFPIGEPRVGSSSLLGDRILAPVWVPQTPQGMAVLLLWRSQS
jgi:hypothetical protein